MLGPFAIYVKSKYVLQKKKKIHSFNEALKRIEVKLTRNGIIFILIDANLDKRSYFVYRASGKRFVQQEHNLIIKIATYLDLDNSTLKFTVLLLHYYLCQITNNVSSPNECPWLGDPKVLGRTPPMFIQGST